MDVKRAVSELREKVAKVDLEILDRLEARARLSKEIRASREAHLSADVGETEWLARLGAHASGDLAERGVAVIFRRIRAEARALEQPVKVASVGPEGGFGHQTALGYFGVTTAFHSRRHGGRSARRRSRARAAFAVFPFESSVDGLFVQSSLTALAETDLVLVGERRLPATYHLMGSVTAPAEHRAGLPRPPAPTRRAPALLDQELPCATVIDVRSPASRGACPRREGERRGGAGTDWQRGGASHSSVRT